jgi:hypothetical protein
MSPRCHLCLAFSTRAHEFVIAAMTALSAAMLAEAAMNTYGT